MVLGQYANKCFLVMKLLPDSDVGSVSHMYGANCWRILCLHCNWDDLDGEVLYALWQEKNVSFLRLSPKANGRKTQALQYIKLVIYAPTACFIISATSSRKLLSLDLELLTCGKYHTVFMNLLKDLLI